MKRAGFRTALLAAALAIVGCESTRLAQPGPLVVGSAYTVTLGRSWSDITNLVRGVSRHVRLLSIDGPLLNRLYLAHDIPPGGGFIDADRRDRDRLPQFRADMTSREVSEMLVETLDAIGLQRVEEESLSPTRFAGAPGVRVLMRAATRDGLVMRALAVGANRGGKLQAVLYLAPAEYFFDRDLAEVEGIIASVAAPESALAR